MINPWGKLCFPLSDTSKLVLDKEKSFSYSTRCYPGIPGKEEDEMTNKTMNGHIICALRLKAQIAELQAELEKHETAIKRGIADTGSDTYKSSTHTATYRIDKQMRFSKQVFINKYSEEEYNACKAETNRTYFKYA